MAETTFTLTQLKGLAGVVTALFVGSGAVSLRQFNEREKVETRKSEIQGQCEGAMTQLTTRLNEAHHRIREAAKMNRCLMTTPDGSEEVCIDQLGDPISAEGAE